MDDIETYLVKDDGIFPNNAHLPVMLYKQVLQVPWLFPAALLKKQFEKNHWKHAWNGGVFTVHHYHSITHELLAAYKGETVIQVGGEQGPKIKFAKGDVLIIPAGVAHKNLKHQDAITCVGAYPNGMDYDVNYGVEGERPQTDKNIKAVKVPGFDPVFGRSGGIKKFWSR